MNTLSQEEQSLLDRTIEELVPLDITLEETHATSSNENETSEEVEDSVESPKDIVPKLFVEDVVSRFSGAAWFNKIREHSIICGGCGGIMSNALFQIARLHPSIINIFDDDKIEASNLGGQMFDSSSIGDFKVDAISKTIVAFSNYHNIFAHPTKYEEDTMIDNIMICGFDNMAARKVFYNNWKKGLSPFEEDNKHHLFIDARLSFDTLQVISIVGEDTYHMKQYEDEFLFTDSEADTTVCSMKQTTFMTCMIASFITNILVNFCANEVAENMTVLPFFTEYDCTTMRLKII